ncbi:MAG: DNA cytosine methyltransferase [Acidiferrobacterales bacterium]|nr:DNA cytosine methyltransferase [Acidiferrobacterales bacterium]
MNSPTRTDSVSTHSRIIGHASTQGRSLNTFIDLFCGVGGFHIAAAAVGLECVFASEIDKPARSVYKSNFGIPPNGDITCIDASDVPDHDLLCAGFPCQPFSIIGNRRGFSDTRGTLFFDIARILERKRPAAFVLENVKQLVTSDGGRIMDRIISVLQSLDYEVDFRVLNALDYGLPQRRERVLIVGRIDGLTDFDWPEPNISMKPLSELLEKSPDKRHYVSDRIRNSRQKAHQADTIPSIWHENKGGNVSSHPFSCALRAGASYNYLLVNGVRRLTPREMFRLQGFPDSFNLHEVDAQARKQAGNAVPVPMVKAVIRKLVNA